MQMKELLMKESVKVDKEKEYLRILIDSAFICSKFIFLSSVLAKELKITAVIFSQKWITSTSAG